MLEILTVRLRRLSAARRRSFSIRRAPLVEAIEPRNMVSVLPLPLMSGFWAPAASALAGSAAPAQVAAGAARSNRRASFDPEPSPLLLLVSPRLDEERVESIPVMTAQVAAPEVDLAESDDWLTLVDDVPEETAVAPLAVRPPATGSLHSRRASGGDGGLTDIVVAQPRDRSETLSSPSSQNAVNSIGFEESSIAATGAVDLPPSTVLAGGVHAPQAIKMANAVGAELTADMEVRSAAHGTIIPLKAPQPADNPLASTTDTPSVSGGYITSRRTSPEAIAEDTAYEIKYSEHFDTESTFEFKLGNNFVTTTNPVNWELWDYNGGPFNDEMITSGYGTHFTYDFDDSFRSYAIVLFWEDINGNGIHDSTHDISHEATIWVQPRKPYYLNIEVSNAIAGTPASQVQGIVEDAQNILLMKDGADDYRAAINLEAVTINTFTATPPGGSRPDPAAIHEWYKHEDQPSDIVFLNDIDRPDTRGATNENDYHQIIIEW